MRQRVAHLLIGLALGLAGGAGAPAQSPAAAGPPRHLSLTGAFSIELPDGWRQLTPEEGRRLHRQSLPGYLIPAGLPADLYPYGPVDAWLEHGFDGRCLCVRIEDGEPDMEASGIERLRSFAAAHSRDGLVYEIRKAELTKIGPHHHPAIEVTAHRVLQPGARPMAELGLFLPTGGRTLILAFRAFEPDFARVLPVYQSAIATLALTRPPRGPAKLTGNLLYAALVGGLVGMALLLLHKRRPYA